MTDTITTAPPTTVKISATNGVKHVVLIINDIEALVASALTIAGEGQIAKAVDIIAHLVTGALGAYGDASAVEITPESITSLLSDDTPLVDPIDAITAAQTELDRAAASAINEVKKMVEEKKVVPIDAGAAALPDQAVPDAVLRKENEALAYIKSRGYSPEAAEGILAQYGADSILSSKAKDLQAMLERGAGTPSPTPEAPSPTPEASTQADGVADNAPNTTQGQ